jgi:hypothetical protein
MVVVWGERYRKYFSDYCLPSLLAPDNIPCISNKQDSRFAIATTAEDWEELNKLDIFKALRAHVEPVLLELPPFSPDDSKMMVMSSGHKKLSNYAYENGSFGVNINPDSIYSDRTVHALQESARRGVKMVLYPGVRFEFEAIVAELKARGYLDEPTAISVPPRVAAGIGVRSPHPFTAACHWDNDCFFEYPVYHYVVGPSKGLMVMHTISMGPIMLDYGAISEHRDEIFDKWTLDGDYAHSNFGHFDVYTEIEYVDDSDTFMVLGFTPKAEDPVAQVPVRGGRLFKDFNKGLQLWRVYSDPVVADPLKKRLYLRAVVIHESDLGAEWRALAARDRRILEKYVIAAIDDESVLAYDAKYLRLPGGARRKPWFSKSAAMKSERFMLKAQARLATTFRLASIHAAQKFANFCHRADFYRRHYSAQGPAHVRYYYYRAKFYPLHYAAQGRGRLRAVASQGRARLLYVYYRVSFFVRHHYAQNASRTVSYASQAVPRARSLLNYARSWLRGRRR